MAKLRAHGRELLRVTRERTFDPDSRVILRDGTDIGPTLTIWERETRSYRSDGHVMLKHDVRFKPDTMDPQGRLHSYGWKLFKKLKPASCLTPESFAKQVRDRIRDGKTSWTIEYDGSQYPNGLHIPVAL